MENMLYIDRIEDGIAFLEQEDGSFLKMPLEDLPDGVKEGSALRMEDGKFTHDAESEQLRRAKMIELQRRMFKKQG